MWYLRVRSPVRIEIESRTAARAPQKSENGSEHSVLPKSCAPVLLLITVVR